MATSTATVANYTVLRFKIKGVPCLFAHTDFDRELVSWMRAISAKFADTTKGRKGWYIPADSRHADVFVREVKAAADRAAAPAAVAPAAIVAASASSAPAVAAPATPKQIAYLQRLVREHGHLGRGFDIATIDRSEASAIIAAYAEEGCRG